MTQLKRFLIISASKTKYVLDADISKCFDQINHELLLNKINAFPVLRRQIKSWLKAGYMDGKRIFPTTEGTPQGGTISPLLANIALHGMEELIKEKFPRKWKGKKIIRPVPALIRYADDFVIIHDEYNNLQVLHRHCHDQKTYLDMTSTDDNC